MEKLKLTDIDTGVIYEVDPWQIGGIEWTSGEPAVYVTLLVNGGNRGYALLRTIRISPDNYMPIPARCTI